MLARNNKTYLTELEILSGMDQKYHDELVNLLHPDTDIATAMLRILISSIMFRNVNVCHKITAVFPMEMSS